MERGQKVKIVRTSNKHAAHHVGKTGVVVGQDAPLGMVVVKLDDGTEYWAESFNLKVIG